MKNSVCPLMPKGKQTGGVLPISNSAVCILNRSDIWKSELELMESCRECDKRAILSKLNIQIRDGRIQKVVRAGMPYYAPVLTGAQR